MAGRLCNGVSTFYQYHLKESRAFCEGLNYRASGTLLGKPLSDNPHASGSDANTAWAAGWAAADAVAPAGTIDPTDAPCCSVPTNVVVDV